MKKLFGILVSLCASMICLTSVSAKQVNLAEPQYNNSYIIGRRVFTLNSYALTAWNVKEATDEFHKNEDIDDTPMYYVNNGKIWKVNADGIDWNNELDIADFNEVFGVNGDPIVSPTIPYDENRVNSKISSVIGTLNDTTEKYGFESIDYDNNNHTVTFNISDGNRNISDYAKSGIVDAIKAFISDDYGAKTVKIDGEDSIDVSTLTEAKIVGLVADALRKVINNEENETLSALEGKSITATVTYGNGETVQYTVEFK